MVKKKIVLLSYNSMISFDELHELFTRSRKGDDTATIQLKATTISSDHFARYLELANQGDIISQNNVGWMYQQARGVQADDAKAFEWYTKAANQGDACAQNNAGLLNRDGQGAPRDDAKAIEWFTKGANQGFSCSEQSRMDVSTGERCAKRCGKSIRMVRQGCE